ncbi:MAG: FAD-binding oxidoreductase [Persicimonas sp.]
MSDANFYKVRDLAEPVEEYVPGDLGELEFLVTESAEGPRRLILGGGEHVRDGVVGSKEFEVVRTVECDRILEIDRESNLVRVEAGVRWGDLRERLIEEGLTLQRYGLHPESATVGGLLARHLGYAPARGGGALRRGCVALTAVSPTLGEYRYLRAPRKASGPDLRHLYMGGEGLFGAILEATVSVFKPFPSRVFGWPAETASRAVAVRRKLAGRGVRPSWCHWSRTTGCFRAAIHAPTRLLDASIERLHAHFDEEIEVKGDDRARELRRELEAAHPARRSAEKADQTVELTYSLEGLGAAVDAIDEGAEIEIVDWSPHSATAYLTFDQAAPSSLEQWSDALHARPVVGGETIEAPDWAQALAEAFDARGRLAAPNLQSSSTP